MHTTMTLGILLAGTALWGWSAQEGLGDSRGAPESGLVPAPLGTVEDQVAGGMSAEEVGRWVAALGSEDLEARLSAYEELVEAGRGREAVRAQIEAWARERADLELAWTARLLLRELEHCEVRAEDRSARHGGGLMPLRGPHGIDPFDWDLTEELFGSVGRHLPQLEDLFVSPGQALPQGGFSQSQGFSLQSGPDGVKVEMREMVDGEEKVKTYEAESMEALLKAYPELKEHIQAGSTLESPFGALEPFSGDLLDPFGGLPRVGIGGGGGHSWFDVASPSPRTDRLGVRVLETDAGLEVVHVLRGSLGAALGLRIGDRIVALNDVSIHSVADVKRALAARKPDQDVRVEVLEAGGNQALRSWSPPASEATDNSGNLKPVF